MSHMSQLFRLCFEKSQKKEEEEERKNNWPLLDLSASPQVKMAELSNQCTG